MQKEHGTVTTWVLDSTGAPKGFGFIKFDGENAEVFFHKTECRNMDRGDIREGLRVKFTVAAGNIIGRKKAVDVEYEN